MSLSTTLPSQMNSIEAGDARRISARAGHLVACFSHFMCAWGGYEVGEFHSEKYCESSELWVYNTILHKWYCYDTEGDVPLARSGSVAQLIEDCLYIHGGHTKQGNTNSIYRLNIKKMEWKKLLSNYEGLLPSPRDKHSSWVYKNNLFCFGGHGPDISDYLWDSGEYVEDVSSEMSYPRGWNNQLLIFDCESHQWSNPKCTGEVPSPRAAHASTRIGDKTYVFGGRHLTNRMNDLYCLDLDTLHWIKPQVTGNVPCGRSWCSFTAVSPTRILLCGGFTQDNKPLADIWIYDVTLFTWTAYNKPFTVPRLWHSCCVTPDDDVIIFGGCCSNILNYTQKAVHTNEVIQFRIQSKSLLQLSVDTLVRYRHKTKPEWKYLPQGLFKYVKLKEQAIENDPLTFFISMDELRH
ncbi:kelch domain-containing protein 2-like [Argonauta hians]